MSEHLTAALNTAALKLEKAYLAAHPDAHRCRNCGDPFTLRIREAESAVLLAARMLGESLLHSASEEES